jgi:hypothetical protein
MVKRQDKSASGCFDSAVMASSPISFEDSWPTVQTLRKPSLEELEEVAQAAV